MYTGAAMNPIKKCGGWVFYTAMWSLTKLGERLNSQRLIYNPLVHMSFERTARINARPIADAVVRLFPDARTVIDVGCGTGTITAEFAARGLKVIGVEYDPRLRRKAARKGVDVRHFDLSKNTDVEPNAPFDVAMSFEVAEHIPPDLSDALVRYMCGSGRRIVFTAAPPGQGGTGHINLRPRTDWIARFQANGLRYDENATRTFAEAVRAGGAYAFIADNAMVFAADQPGAP
jgi:SAM-dependent methyltransferase